MPYHPLYCEASHKDQDSGEYNPANLAFVILLVNAALQQLPMLKDWDAHRWSVILASLYSFYFRKYLFPQSAENSIKYGPSCWFFFILLMLTHSEEPHSGEERDRYLAILVLCFFSLFQKYKLTMNRTALSFLMRTEFSVFIWLVNSSGISFPHQSFIAFYSISLEQWSQFWIKQQKILNSSLQCFGSRKYYRIAKYLVFCSPRQQDKVAERLPLTEIKYNPIKHGIRLFLLKIATDVT